MRAMHLTLWTVLILSGLPCLAGEASEGRTHNSSLFAGPLGPLPPAAPIRGRTCDPDPCRVDFRATGVEVTQGVQCFDSTEGDLATFCPPADNAFPLIVGKPIYIRVYADFAEPLPAGAGPTFTVPVRATFKVINTAGELVETNADGRLNLGGSFTLSPRERSSGSANFTFLCTTCREGDRLDVDAMVLSPPGTEDLFPENNTATASLPFVARRALHIEYRPVEVRGQKPDPLALTTAQTFLIDGYPASAVTYRRGSDIQNPRLDDPAQCTPSLTDDGDVCAETLFRLLNREAILRRSFCAEELAAGPACELPDQVVAWLPAQIWRNGYSDPFFRKGGHGFVTVIDSMYTYGQAGSPTLAHEIGHNLGGQHPCLDDAGWPYRAPDYPDDSDKISFRTQETGVRPHPIVSGALFPRSGHLIDVMQGHHCRGIDTTSALDKVETKTLIDMVDPDKIWLSPYTYNQLFCALSPDRAEFFAARFRKGGISNPFGSCNVIPVSPRTGAFLVASGFLPAAGGGGTIETIDRIDSQSGIRS